MKNRNRYTVALLACLTFAGACSYEFPEAEKPTSGEADFSKMVVVGSSLSAGFTNGALYTAGQDNSFVKIMADQMAMVGGGEFNQPDINAVNGFYGVAAGMPPIPDGTVLGRLYLKGTTGPRPTPKIPGDLITAYAGDKAALNNFSARGVTIQTAQIPQLGGPTTANPYYNPFYGRFASNPGTSTLLGDAIAADGTFFVFWLGNDDVLGYATNGADQANPALPITSVAAFTPAYNAAIAAMLAGNDAKGVLANIPDVTALPYFSLVAHNAIPLPQANADALNAGFAGYNAAVEGLKNPAFGPTHGLTAAQLEARKIVYAAGNNQILIADESAVSLAAGFDALEDNGIINSTQRAQLAPYEQVREAAPTDLIALPAGSILGTTVGGNPQLLNGLTVPLADKYVLLPSEITQIQTRIADFNAVIAAAVNANSDRLALVDVNTILSDFKASGGVSINGSALTPSITPPFGGFSLDGIHLNARGSAFMANKFIQVINAKFGSNIPLANPNSFAGNELPIP